QLASEPKLLWVVVALSRSSRSTCWHCSPFRCALYRPGSCLFLVPTRGQSHRPVFCLPPLLSPLAWALLRFLFIVECRLHATAVCCCFRLACQLITASTNYASPPNNDRCIWHR